MKREYIILSIGLFLIIFNLILIANPDFSNILGAATSQTTSVVMTVVARENNVTVPASGNISFADDDVNHRVTRISGLTESWVVNITLYGSSYPSAFSERQPNGTEVGPLRIEYIDLVINQTNTNGSYVVFFNVSQSELNISPVNISLFVFEDSDSKWNNLTTTIINDTNDPRQFSVAATHFSKFLIGQSPPVAAEDEETPSPSPSPSSGGGGGGGGSGRAAAVEAPPITGEALLDFLVKKDIPIKPIRIPGNLFDVWVIIPEKYQQLYPLDKLVGEINLVNIKRRGATAVSVEYSIEDADGQQLFKSFETKVVENEIAYLKELSLPPDINPGYYLFKVKIIFDQDVAIAGFPFHVIERPPVIRLPYSLWRELVLIIAIIIAIVWAVRALRKRKRSAAEHKKESMTTEKVLKHKMVRYHPQRQKVLEQLRWLKDKYERGLLPQGMYKRRLLQAKKELEKK